jgi:hypothetical protein
MEETQIQNGLVGFFDILGYQTFLENNDVETATSEVINIINDIGSTVKTSVIGVLEAPTDEDKKKIEDIQWLVFSDSILMLMEWDEEDAYKWGLFTAAAIKLCRHMFDVGLPLRGAIKKGKYLVSKSCFAGRTIIEAYHTEMSLNLAACAMDEEIMHIIEKDIKNQKALRLLVVNYMTPLNGGQYKKMHLLNFILPDDSKSKRFPTDIKQEVLHSFWSHNKDMTLSAEIKASNTETCIRYLQHKFPRFFASKPA